MPLLSDHWNRCIPNSGRCSVSTAAASSSSGEQRMTRVELRRKTSSPPGRKSRAASGIHLEGSAQIGAPYSETTRSKDSSGSGTSSPNASTSSSPRPNFSLQRRAVSSCAGVGSTPTTRAAPAFFSQAPKYAVPQPSSTTSLPTRSGRACSSDSGTLKTPHVISSAAHACSARASVYLAFSRVHASTVGSVTEPECDLALRRLRGVGAVHEVVGHRGGEVAPDRPRRRVRGIRRPDRRAQRRDRSFALDDERPGRPRADELDELAEERLLAVLGVVLLPELAAGG